MKQKLSDWASIAEIVSSVAIVLTLIILIVDVRENSELLRISAYSEATDKLNNFNNALFTDTDAMRVWRSFIDEEANTLDAVESSRLRVIASTLFRTYESAYFAWQADLMREEEWNRFNRSICIFYQRAESEGNGDPIPNVLTDEFLEYMVEECAE